MHVHILGICGTFMGGIAAIAKSLGHTVTGSDANVYPPMSTQLEQLGIELFEGFSTEQFNPQPDLVIIGNALSRGNPAVEYVLDRNLPYTSGPEWLRDHLLTERWVIAIAGTHGKTTTTAMTSWILEYAGLEPGFLIGGVAENFGISARLGKSPFFVIEADEYDCAFFDKRAKFVHYRPNTLVMNNLEFDHADIYPDLAAIQRQFHHVVRTVPSSGLVLYPQAESALRDVIAQGCWSNTQCLGEDWDLQLIKPDASQFDVLHKGSVVGQVNWALMGLHNAHNALMAIAAAHHAGVELTTAIDALGSFKNVKRRMELRADVNGIKVFDDFAHHPSAIKTTLDGLRKQVGAARIIAILEPRSNTMKMGVHRDSLAQSWQDADHVLLFEDTTLDWSLAELAASSEAQAECFTSTTDIVSKAVAMAQSGDYFVIMSNGGFNGIHAQLIDALAKQEQA